MKNAQTIHCFLIDDDPEEIDIFNIALQDLDIPVKCNAYTNCSDALLALIREKVMPDCIFLDLYMGATDGKECLNKIINTEIIAQVPVVILSGSGSELQKEELKKLGAQEFMVKSTTIDGLKKQLMDYFTARFSLDEGLTI